MSSPLANRLSLVVEGVIALSIIGWTLSRHARTNKEHTPGLDQGLKLGLVLILIAIGANLAGTLVDELGLS